MSDIGTLFLLKSREYLTDSYLPKIERALNTMSDDDLWWQPNEASNSIANLLLHMTGSIQFWVVSFVGGAPSDRVRELEFKASAGHSRQELIDGLRNAVRQADEVLAQLTVAQLLETREDSEKAMTVLGAVYHGVEHFSMHTGQVLQLVKIRQGVDLRLSD